MDRRVAVKQMTLIAGGLLTLPDWANAWTKASVNATNTVLGPTQVEMLTQLVDTLIPATDTPGAKALNVPDFVQKMLVDCYEPPVQQNVEAGLTALDGLAKTSTGQSFSACNTAQRINVLKQIEASPDPDLAGFYKLVKSLTIQGYTTSEYVMTKFLNYSMIPGHYYGCVPAPVAAR